MDLTNVRNIGISAHIDSGKTTLSERVLYYSGRIHKIEEVKGDGDGATMDHMELEKERGITITSAATTVTWECSLEDDKPYTVNLIDTPGHVDFTVEVERSLRVLDGAILVLCSVGGVQAQSLTVDRQMRRYEIPRLAFINKMDRTGADAYNVVEQIASKLHANPVMMQIPMGAGEHYVGCIDLIRMVAIYNDGEKGETVREEDIPAEYADKAQEKRTEMLDALSMYSDELMELLMEEKEVSVDLIYSTTRKAVLTRGITPVYVGSAFKNKGVQTLLDAVAKFLPSPYDREMRAKLVENPDETMVLEPVADKPFVGMAFKIVEDPYGQLTYTRIYQGTVRKGEMYFNQRTGKKDRFSRILRMHSDKREDIDEASAGDIVAIMGIDCASGDTYAQTHKYCSLENMFVPDPVIKMAVAPKERGDADRLGKALARFRKEDPTFKVFTDEETSETIVAGMGELHLEVYIERIRREYKVEVEVGAPKVSYRETPTQKVEFDYKHKKQSGGSGQFAHIVGYLEPLPEDAEEEFQFEDSIVSGRIPKQFIPAVEKGFKNCIPKGTVAKYPVVGLYVKLEDGSYHDVDSSEMAFQIAARGCFAENFPKTKPVLLEPIMKIEVECPEKFQGDVVGDVTRRRGMIVSTEMREDGSCEIVAEIPLAETFGYETDLRSMTQGQGSSTMELDKYSKVPNSVQEEIVAERMKETVGAK